MILTTTENPEDFPIGMDIGGYVVVAHHPLADIHDDGFNPVTLYAIEVKDMRKGKAFAAVTAIATALLLLFFFLMSRSG